MCEFGHDIPLLEKHFEDVDVRYFGGSILLYALESEFYNNFDFDNTSHRRLLEMLFDIEDTFIEIGEISSIMHILFAKKIVEY